MVAETSWHTSTSRSTGLRNFSGASARRTRRPRAATALVAQRARARLVHAHERRLGHREEARAEQQHDDHRRPARCRSSDQAAAITSRPGSGARSSSRSRASMRSASSSLVVVPAEQVQRRRARRAARARRRASTRARRRCARRPPGRSTTSPTSWGSRRSGGSPGPVPPASGTRPRARARCRSGSSGRRSGPSLPMNCWLSAAIVGSSTKISETSARPRTPSSASAPLRQRAPALEVDRSWSCCSSATKTSITASRRS